jgi:hypothetical protein
MTYNCAMAQEAVPPIPETHKAADRAGKTLGNMAGSINKALGLDDEPVVLDRKGSHVSIKNLEDLIDKALEENR